MWFQNINLATVHRGDVVKGRHGRGGTQSKDITILQVTGTEDSFGGRKNESEGQIQRTMKETRMAGRRKRGLLLMRTHLCFTHNTKCIG